MTFVADTDGESIILGQSSDAPSTAASEYNHLTSTAYTRAWSAEASTYQGGQPTTLEKLYVKLSVAPGVGKSDLIGVRVTGSTVIAVTIAGTDTTGNNVADSQLLVNYDEVDTIFTPTDTPAATIVYWGVVGYIAAAAGWSHKFLGVANAAIGKINDVAIASIGKVKGVA